VPPGRSVWVDASKAAKWRPRFRMWFPGSALRESTDVRQEVFAEDCLDQTKEGGRDARSTVCQRA
jgi:hypothetical protein